jgi:hypothetical protein
MTARGLALAAGLLVCSCYQLAGDDEAAPVASAIPQAAHSAIGADYPAGSATTGFTTGIPECDAYFRKIATCKGLPPATLKALQDTADQMRETIRQTTAPEARKAVAEACKQTADALTMCDTQL